MMSATGLSQSEGFPQYFAIMLWRGGNFGIGRGMILPLCACRIALIVDSARFSLACTTLSHFVRVRSLSLLRYCLRNRLVTLGTPDRSGCGSQDPDEEIL